MPHTAMYLHVVAAATTRETGLVAGLVARGGSPHANLSNETSAASGCTGLKGFQRPKGASTPAQGKECLAHRRVVW
jgi:hypothetical protein